MGCKAGKQRKSIGAYTALSNMALSYYQNDKKYFARTIFPMCPVTLSSDSYYIFKDSRESEIERTITDALLVHPATEYVRNFIFDYSSGDAVVSFIVKGAQWEEEETISTVFEKGVS